MILSIMLDTFKNDIFFEFRNVARERTGHNNDLDQNDIVDVKKEMKIPSPSKIQVTMDQDDTILVKKESKIKSTSLVQDKMDKMIWYTLTKNLRQCYHFQSKTHWRKTAMFTLLG